LREHRDGDEDASIAFALFMMCLGYPALGAGLLVAVSLLATHYG
jgi:hypothetical protein